MVEDIVQAIKSKKELGGLDDAFVQEKVEKILRSDNRIKKKYEGAKSFEQFSRSKEFETLLKNVRKELRVVYGVFQEENPRELLQQLKKNPDDVTALYDLLASHTSSKERIHHYNEIYKELAKRIPKPATIVDLGCGLNPLSAPLMEKHSWKPEWIASDISSNDMDFLKEAFTVLGIKGKTVRLDLTKEYEKIPSGDVTFLFKLLDSLEEAERHISYKIFDHIKSKWIVVSFPTKSLGGKKSISTRGRLWFERLLQRKELQWETFQTINELFYVIRR